MASAAADAASSESTAAGRTAWARNLGAPVRDFLSTETGGAVVLVAAAVAALVWANSPWPHSYESFWDTRLALSLGGHTLSASLRQWVNEGLMALFFLVVGLEAKRELDLGELRERNRIAIPVVAALGGMALCVGIYLAINAGGSGAGGWGTAMSTDTALALGALALVAPEQRDAPARVPADARGGRRSRRVDRDRARLQHPRIAARAGDRAGAVRGARAAALCRELARASGGDRRDRGVAGDVRVGDRPGRGRPGDRAGDERLPAGARRSRARDRADAILSRAAHARARLSRPARAGVDDLAQRAVAVPAAPVDELRRGAAVRAGERRDPR